MGRNPRAVLAIYGILWAFTASVAAGDRQARYVPRELRGSLLPASPSPSDLPERIRELLRGPLRNGVTSIYAIDAVTGEALVSIESDRPANPASNVKLLSTAAALATLGPDFSYKTTLLGPRPTDHALRGDVYMYGSWDPTLDRAGLDAIATAVAAKGVNVLTGDIVLAAGDRDAIAQGSLPVTIESTLPGRPVRVTVPADLAFVDVLVEAITVTRRASRNVACATRWVRDGQALRLQLTVRGTLGHGRKIERTVGIAERAEYTGALLSSAFARAGIRHDGGVRFASLASYIQRAGVRGWLPQTLAEKSSVPLVDIVTVVNKRSVNWLADRVISSAAALAQGRDATMQAGVEAMYQWLSATTGLAAPDVYFDTGSGLSYATRFSARQVVAVLRAALSGPGRLAFQRTLAIGGAGGSDGTLSKRFQHQAYRIFAKTGTLATATALSGLLEPSRGHPVYFSIITNDHPPRLRLRIRQAHERMVTALALHQAR